MGGGDDDLHRQFAIQPETGHDLHVELRRYAGHRRAGEQRVDPRGQFPRRKRLGHIVVGAMLQASDLVLLLAFCTQHDDRNAGELLMRAQS